MTYLVVSCDKLCDCMESRLPCEVAWSNNRFKAQLLLLLLLGQSTLLFGLFLLLHSLPDLTRDCPMIHQYVIFLTFLLVNIIMLTNMRSTRRVPSLVEGLACSIRFDECLVNPNW